MPDDPPFIVVFDSNIWIAERMMRSAMGSAALFALTSARARIGLPQVVELEVNRYFLEEAKQVTEEIAKGLAFLRQFSALPMNLLAPSEQAIEEGIKDRWLGLDGILLRIPFTHDHAQSSLKRIVDHVPPSGEKSEQFRDCCIWEAALELAAKNTVHLVTNDAAFYATRDRRETAAPLLQELSRLDRRIEIHSSLKNLMERVGAATAPVDENKIGSAIVDVLRLQLRKINFVPQDAAYAVGAAVKTVITGFATPKPPVVGVSFEVEFPVRVQKTTGQTTHEMETILTVTGTCSYDPGRNEVADIEVVAWSHRLKGTAGGLDNTYWQHPDRFERMFAANRIRLIG